MVLHRQGMATEPGRLYLAAGPRGQHHTTLMLKGGGEMGLRKLGCLVPAPRAKQWEAVSVGTASMGLEVLTVAQVCPAEAP